MIRRISFATILSICGVNSSVAADESTSPVLQEVVVTGSRVIRDALLAPTPVTVASAEQLTATQPHSLAEGLNQLPVFALSTGPSKGGSTGTAGNFLNLRALGPARTLVLFDGHRVPPVQGSAVNVDFFPAPLLERVDTVTGGASAAYGSDAVSGVVNFVLNKNFTGLTTQLQSGVTQYGDGVNYKIGVAGGAGFDDNRGHVLFGLEYANSEGAQGSPQKSPTTNAKAIRDWMRDYDVVVANPVAGASPSLVTLRNVRMTLTPLGGVFVGGPLNGTAFNLDGTQRTYDFGSPRSGTWATGGEGYDIAPINTIITPQSHASLFTRASYDISPDITTYVEGHIATSSTANDAGTWATQFFAPNGIPIRVDNAYLPENLREQMVAAGVSSANFGFNSDRWRGTTDYVMHRIVAGIEGRFGDTWKWSGDYTYGRVRNDQAWLNAPIASSIFYGSDAVRAPTGDIVCRITLTQPSLGCVPLNFFGRPSYNMTDAEQKYLIGSTEWHTIEELSVAEAEVSGDPFSTWAGPVSVAVGGGFRAESGSATSNPTSQRRNPYTNIIGDWVLFNSIPLEGKYHVWEAFAETAVPLLKDSVVRSLDFNGAVRYTDYSTSGGVTTWKLGLTSEVFEGIRLRAARSRDIRAPNISEYFAPDFSGYAQIRDPQRGNESYTTQTITGGNRSLQPERATTTTFGIAFNPYWLHGISGSIDAYNIKITDAIAVLAQQQILDECAAGNATLCDLVVRDASSGLISYIRRNQLNLASLETRGIDFELAYALPLGGGRLNLRGMVTYVDKLVTTTPGSKPIDRAGEVGTTNGGVPHWTTLTTAQYDIGQWTVQWIQHYTAGGAFDNALMQARGTSTDEINGMFWSDLSVRYQIGKAQLFGVVRNVFNEDPPRIPSGSLYGNGTQTNMLLYNAEGRAFTVGVNFAL